MKHILRSSFAALVLTVALAPQIQAQDRNHSFDVFDVVVASDTVTFVGSPSAASATNLPMEARVCNAANSVTFTGQTHTFTSTSETFDYSVDISAGGFGSNDDVIVSVTDQTGSTDCNAGAEGYIQSYPLGFGIAGLAVPTLGFTGLALLVLLVSVIAFQQRSFFIR